MNMKRFGLVKVLLALGLAFGIGGAAVADVNVKLRDGHDFVVEDRDVAGVPRFSVNRTGGVRFPRVTELERDALVGVEQGECVWNTTDDTMNCMNDSGSWQDLGR